MPIELKQALGIVESGNWFACSFITADQAKQTGGEVITLKKCRLATRQGSASNAVRPSSADRHDSKNPRHHYHFTRNLELENGLMRKVHPLLIVEINGQPVI